MRYTIEDFAKENSITKNPQIHLSCERISLRVPEGGIGKGTFEILLIQRNQLAAGYIQIQHI